MTAISRRGILLGLGAAIAAPAIVRATSLMPVRVVDMDFAAVETGVVSEYHTLVTFRELFSLPPALLRMVRVARAVENIETAHIFMDRGDAGRVKDFLGRCDGLSLSLGDIVTVGRDTPENLQRRIRHAGEGLTGRLSSPRTHRLEERYTPLRKDRIGADSADNWYLWRDGVGPVFQGLRGGPVGDGDA